MNKIFIMVFLFFSSSVQLFANSDSDIKGIKWPFMTLSNYMIVQLVVIFLLLFLVWYNYYIWIEKRKNKKSIDEKAFFKKNLKINLKKLKLNVDDYSKSDFYRQLNLYFRQYFSILDIKNTETLSLQDVKKLELDTVIIQLYEKSYINEFNNKTDLKKTRLDIIDKLILLIK